MQVGEEISQAAKYVPYLEIVFGTNYEVIPALVLTTAKDYFDFAAIGRSDSVLPVCSGDMLFNVFDEYLGFLSDGNQIPIKLFEQKNSEYGS